MTETFNLQGLEPGTVVITKTAVNALLEPFSEQVLKVKDLCISEKNALLQVVVTRFCRSSLHLQNLNYEPFTEF